MLFGRKKEEETSFEAPKRSADKIVFNELEDDDHLALNLVKELMNGNPLIINFSKLNEIECNKMLAFFQGATVALNGKALRIDADIYLFAKKEDLLDGSLREFVKDLKKA
jgi:cell division inhibitor SepF